MILRWALRVRKHPQKCFRIQKLRCLLTAGFVLSQSWWTTSGSTPPALYQLEMLILLHTLCVWGCTLRTPQSAWPSKLHQSVPDIAPDQFRKEVDKTRKFYVITRTVAICKTLIFVLLVYYLYYLCLLSILSVVCSIFVLSILMTGYIWWNTS